MTNSFEKSGALTSLEIYEGIEFHINQLEEFRSAIIDQDIDGFGLGLNLEALYGLKRIEEGLKICKGGLDMVKRNRDMNKKELRKERKDVTKS